MEKYGKVYCIMEFESNGRKRRRGKKNIGFLTAVVLCCAAVTLAGLSNFITKQRSNNEAQQQVHEGDFWTADNSLDDYYEPLGVTSSTDTYVEENPNGGLIDLDLSQSSEFEEEDPPVVNLSTEQKPDSGTSEEESVAVSKTLLFDPPMPGAVIKEYSGTELVYCSTMGDWRVHRGIDIAGEKGSKVCSAADGTVTYVTEDPLYGKTVAITHSDGSILYYSGLDTVSVKRDDRVKRGDKIGTLGDIPCESSDSAHLHLEMVRGGKYVDPLSMYS